MKPNQNRATWNKAASRRMRTRLNGRLLIGTLLAVVILSGVGWWRHVLQSAALADAFLTEAERARDREDWKGSARLLSDYLLLRPGDAHARTLLAEVSDRSASGALGRVRAIEHYRRAIGLAEPGSDTEVRLRRRLAELLLTANRFQEAEAEADILLARSGSRLTGAVQARETAAAADLRLLRGDEPVDEVALRVKAIAGCRQARPVDRSSVAAAWANLARAVEALPEDVELADLAVEFVQTLPAHASLSEAERQKRIDAILDRTVEAAPESAAARLLRFRYRAQAAPREAAADLEIALALDPEDYEVQLTAGRAALRRAEEARAANDARQVSVYTDQARSHLQKASDLDPQREEAHLALGQIAFVLGETDEAIRLWQSGLKQLSGPGLELRLRIAEAAIAAGDSDRAETALKSAALATEAFTVQSSNAARLVAATLHNRMAILRARLLLLRNEPASAAALLNQLALSGADGTDGGSDLISQRDLGEVLYLLGLAHSQMKSWDLAAEAFQKAVQAGIQSHHALAACAFAWQRAGHLTRAAEYYTKLATSQDAPPRAMLELAELRLEEQLQRPASQRDWTEFDRVFSQAEETHSDDWRLAILAARRSLGEGGPESRQRAAKLLKAAQEVAPEEPHLWQKLVLLYHALGDDPQAEGALQRYKQFNPSPEEQLAVEVDLLMNRGEYERAAHLLNERLSTGGAAEPLVLQRLWVVELQRGNWRTARQHLLTLHKLSPSDIQLVEHLATLDLQVGDYASAAKWEDRLLRLEGENGTLWRYFSALRQLAESESTSDERFLEAKRYAEQVRALRPAWGPGLALIGRIHAAEGAAEQATQDFEKAVKHGDTSLATYEQLIRQLYVAGRLGDAEAYLAHLQDVVPASSRLSHVFISLAVLQQQWPLAHQRAEEAVRHRPSDPLAHVWLGHVLTAQGRTEEAEAAYRRAVEADNVNPVAWQALASFYHQSDRPDAAEDALQTLREKAEMPPLQMELLIANHYLRQGDSQRAQDVLRQAEARFPQSAEVRRQLATLLLVEDPGLAEAKLREALKLAPDSDEIRRTLATVLAARGGSRRWNETIALFQQSSATEQNESDLRLQAALLVRRGGEANRSRAVKLLEQLARRPAPKPNELLLLAQLYESEGRVAAARAQYDALVLRAKPEPVHLLQAIDFYLRNGDLSEAGGIIDELAGRAAAGAGGTGNLSRQWAALKARYLLEAEDSDAVVRFLQNWRDVAAAGESGALQRSRAAAAILLDLGMCSTAEAWLRRLVETDELAYSLLARSLALQERHREALAMCVERAGDELSASTLALIAELLSCGTPAADDFEFIRPLLQKAEAQLNDARALFALGLIAVLEENNAEAIEYFEAVRSQHPADVRTLNNLATLYGEQPGGIAKALQCIEAAIDTAGPQPGLLDTQGMLHLQQGDVDKAVTALQQAVAVPVPDPRYLFHLAAALEQAGKRNQAVEVYRRAGERGLKDQFLTKGDKDLLASLDRRLSR